MVGLSERNGLSNMKANMPNKKLVIEMKAALRERVTVSSNKIKAFFKTDVGDYAEGDQFIGVTVPNIRKVAKAYRDVPLHDLAELLASKINEERLLALIILVAQYAKADQEDKEILYQFYVNHIKQVNNWNLVDSSAHLIIGAHLWNKDTSLLFELARSENLWERRIAIVATWYFIRKNDVALTFAIARMLLDDTHDLIHKAVGWMLREAGKKDVAALKIFLNQHAQHMPRTMLRYAIEKFPGDERKSYLA